MSLADQEEVKNAKIESTMLGIEDHGVLTFYLTLDYGGSGQAAGGYVLDEPLKRKGKFVRRVGTAGGADLILRILKLLNVDRWESLPGCYVRVRASWNKVSAIGHPLRDQWISFEEHFEEWRRGDYNA